ncbi:hypothetical protein V6R21_10235 [Limibacter armeniacum]|uniref:DUF6985 domain-containing protein n=1 Tax=Limibacter armeniacum TaxID=466084 RepID=UPI002FE5C095
MKFEFNGEWNFSIELPLLGQTLTFEKRTVSNDIPVTINDSHDLEPDPEQEKINAIEFIIENEVQLLEEFHNQIKDEIFPLHKTYIDDEEIFFPKFNSANELGKVLGLNQITILGFEKDNYAYTQFDFNFSADPEHGISFILHKNRLVEHEEIGSVGYDNVYKELGINPNEHHEGWHQQYLNREIKLHEPLAKYGKLKPWQAEINSEFISSLIKDKNNERFIELIESNKIDLSLIQYDKNLLEIAVVYKNLPIVKYLVEHNLPFRNSISYCRSNDIQFLKQLVDLGLDINQPAIYDRSLAMHEIYEIMQGHFHKRENIDEIIEQRVSTLKELLQLGASLDNCDSDKSNYIECLEKQYAKHFIEKTGIIELIEAI